MRRFNSLQPFIQPSYQEATNKSAKLMAQLNVWTNTISLINQNTGGKKNVKALAIRVYWKRNGPLHSRKQTFLAQATPGAGKTFMAANLAKGLFERSMIDFVICFSPSKTVSSSIQSNFSETLQDEMDGKFGSLGTSITYQSITHLDDVSNRLLKYRVLCVFDEIHHCGGDNNENSNVWGQLILCKIKKVATYTLALTGTPWRSNLTPLYSRHTAILRGRLYVIINTH